MLLLDGFLKIPVYAGYHQKEYTIIEKTGHEKETQELFVQLQDFNIRQFTRSGRVAVTKLRKELLTSYLKERDQAR
jgi:acetolactate synthase I/III small subunit